jgi:putative transposase
MGSKRSVLTEGHGLPIAFVTAGANAHDVKLLEKTLDNLVVFRPAPTKDDPQNLCLDAGYVGYDEEIMARGYIPHIRPRGEEKQEIERNPEFKARRWVVEVSHSFVNRFRKLLVRFEKKDVNYRGLIEFAFAIIVWRKLIPVHDGMVIVG